MTAAPPLSAAAAPQRTLARPRPGGTAVWLVLAAIVAVGVWAVTDLKINIATFVDSARNAADFAGRMFPLDFPPVGELLELCGKTLAIVVSATLLSVLISVPLAILAAANTTPHRSVRVGARTLVVLARAVPDVVLAIVFFRIFGLGAMTGVLAMGLHSVGMVAKLYADAVEQVDEGARSAVRAGGAGTFQELVTGVLPQVLPAFVATALHRLDINLRISVVLGFVGVDGLGYAIATAFQSLDYPRGMALALVVLILCVAVELLSGAIRRALLRAHDDRKAVHIPVQRGNQVSPGWTVHRVRRAAYALVTVLVIAASVWGADLSPVQFFGALGDLGHTAGLFWPPDTGGIFGQLLDDLWMTVQIALGATVLGAVLAVPIGALAARNVAPVPWVARTFRLLVVLIRGIPELVLAIVFVVITGLGAVAGTLALAVGAIGLLGKLVADSLEEVDPGVEQAIRATGAGPWQVFFTGTLPQAAPAFVAHVLYQLDVNIRSATLLGIVGAGGIGFDLLSTSRILDFGMVTTILLLVFATVLFVELLAGWLRHVVR
ncbi:phosphonate ABC transporter, permease protein PhnE [Amycolatopsis sp. FDAARGOS 1241]|uniref:phosphonate ABC transporter, permease protein PhnE n=1 Tax=Amycolatopsis sp. FDAARGOS 1241 TaxID=2778070 RepID=UPI00195094CF|nr:phosphonate ABC transporter, permease protein PhnE [Amycolatopsis sp. FDAARGOS 1241]QRP43502.1 phosphonate ABC transporter, permease protein PhnE [Amycolatopsis sp. FDAARGOS 1241]